MDLGDDPRSRQHLAALHGASSFLPFEPFRYLLAQGFTLHGTNRTGGEILITPRGIFQTQARRQALRSHSRVERYTECYALD